MAAASWGRSAEAVPLALTEWIRLGRSVATFLSGMFSEALEWWPFPKVGTSPAAMDLLLMVLLQPEPSWLMVQPPLGQIVTMFTSVAMPVAPSALAICIWQMEA